MKSLLFLGALVAPAVAFAADSTPLDPMLVSATRTPVRALEALASTVVIGRDEIERSLASDIGELLRLHAGIEIARNGGPGQVASVFVRGGESNHTLILVDGVRINPATSGGAALQNLAPEMIERIEIVKGPRTTLYGPDAIAGVINIITRGAAGGRIELAGRAGSNHTQEISGGFAQGGTTNFSLDAQLLESEGLPTCDSSTLDRGYQRSSVNARGTTSLGKATFGARVWSAQGHTDYLDFCDPAFGNNPLSQDFRNQAAEIFAEMHPLETWSMRLSFSRALDSIEQQEPNFLGEFDHVRTTRPRLDWHNVLQAGRANRISFGAQAAREEVDARSFGDSASEERDLWSVFAQEEFSLGRQRALAAVAFADHDAFGSEVTWNAEYGVVAWPGSRLIVAAGTGFRAPDATDRFGFGGNPDLAPEKARNYEAGVRQQFGSHHVIDLRAFIAEVENLISVECDAFFNCLARNVDEYRNDGIELSYQGRFEAWDLRLSALQQDPRSESRPDPCSGEARLCRRAERTGALGVVRRFGTHSLALDVTGSSERLDFGGVKLPGYALVHLGGSVQLDPGWRLQLRAENLLDKDYQTAAGFNQPGASVFVGLRFES